MRVLATLCVTPLLIGLFHAPASAQASDGTALAAQCAARDWNTYMNCQRELLDARRAGGYCVPGPDNAGQSDARQRRTGTGGRRRLLQPVPRLQLSGFSFAASGATAVPRYTPDPMPPSSQHAATRLEATRRKRNFHPTADAEVAGEIPPNSSARNGTRRLHEAAGL
jgi:hypothetical protein